VLLLENQSLKRATPPRTARAPETVVRRQHAPIRSNPAEIVTEEATLFSAGKPQRIQALSAEDWEEKRWPRSDSAGAGCWHHERAAVLENLNVADPRNVSSEAISRAHTSTTGTQFFSGHSRQGVRSWRGEKHTTLQVPASGTAVSRDSGSAVRPDCTSGSSAGNRCRRQKCDCIADCAPTRSRMYPDKDSNRVDCKAEGWAAFSTFPSHGRWVR